MIDHRGETAETRSSRSLVAAAIILAAFLLAVACAREQATRSQTMEDSMARPTPSGPGDLFVLSAPRGTAAAITPDEIELVLADVAPTVTSFTDRPSRQASPVQIADFAGRWESLFGSDPPNAALVTHSDAGTTTVSTVTLDTPSYDPSSKSITFRAKYLQREEAPRVDIPVAFGRAELFVDPSDSSPVPGQTKSLIPQWPNNPISVTFSNVPAQNLIGVVIDQLGQYGGWIFVTVHSKGGQAASLPVSNITPARNGLFIHTATNIDSLTFEMMSCSSGGTIQVSPQNIPSGASITMDAGAGKLTMTGPGNYELKIANAQDCVRTA